MRVYEAEWNGTERATVRYGTVRAGNRVLSCCAEEDALGRERWSFLLLPHTHTYTDAHTGLMFHSSTRLPGELLHCGLGTARHELGLSC